MVNRIAGLWECPKPKGPFSDTDALYLMMAYRRNPADVPCPKCGPGEIEVLAFIEPSLDKDNYAQIRDPNGEYAAALYCHKCKRSIGILISS